MCLLIVQPEGTVWSDEHIADFYTRNRDGIGVMWAEDGYLCHEKIIPKDVNDAIAFVKQHVNSRACAWHLRMRTHGDIDHENTHPYEIFGITEEHEMPMLLMHNGVLHTGNQNDTSKSDTWHYIKDYLRVLLAADPALAFTPEFKEVIGKHIGNNRFAIMNHEGKIAVINKYQGVTFQGAWLSNEYAWSAQKYLPPKATYYTPSMQSKWGNWNATTGKFEEPTAKKSSAPKKGKRKQYKSMDGASTSSGGSKPTGLTTSEKNSINGVSVDCKWLDDVLEIRSLLDAFYVDNGTTNKQIECLIEECGITKAYLAVELLGDGEISEKSWDALTTNRSEMRWFKNQPMSYWYPDRVDAQLTKIH